MKKLTLYTLTTMVLLASFATSAFALTKLMPGINGQVEAQGKVEMRDGDKGRLEASSTTNTKINEEKLEKRDDRNEKIEDRTDRKFGKMTDRFTLTINRIQNIMTRLDSRIQKIKTAGGNTTPAEKFEADAKVQFSLATSSIATLKANATIADSTTATSTKAYKDAFKALQKSGNDIQKELAKTQSLLNRAVASLMGLKVGLTASSTVETH